jgi:hypothetical protein
MRELRRMGSSLDERGAGAVSADKIRIVLVHEADPAKGGCEFGTFFGTTPQGLIDEGIYKDIAIALHTPPHRAVSLALVAQALGATEDAATKDAGRLWRARSQHSQHSRVTCECATPRVSRHGPSLTVSGLT